MDVLSQLEGAGDILVVDDTPQNLVAIEAALDGMRNQLVLARSGEEALRLVLERDFALILLDVQMPNMDGLETARLIRGRKRNHHVPIIFVTAHDRDSEDVLAAYRLGAVDFLFKPIDAEILRAKTSVFVELHSRTAEVAKQARLIREHEETLRHQALAEQRRTLEASALRASLEHEKRHGNELLQKNADLESARAQLQAINRHLAEDDRRKDEFIAVLAHELRNPLAALMSGIELLGTQPTSDKVQMATPVMRRQCDHLIHLIDDLIDTTRLATGKMTLRDEFVSVQQVLADAVALTTTVMESKDHRMDVTCECPDAQLRGDRVRLAQMIGNLLSNAAKYTDPGGEIRLVAERGPDDTIAIKVSDKGRGMPPALVARAFDMFVQASADGGGLGVGLPLVRQLATLHGGTVSARSEGPDLGSEFELVLPEATAHEAAPPAVEVPVADAPSTMRVVLIDDNDDVREMTGLMLRQWGYDVVEADSGEAGVAAVQRERPHVAIVDIGLPDIEGYEVARRLRSALGDACPRLVALTGYSQPKDRELALEAGFDVHLAKPADAEGLQSVLQPHAARLPKD